MRWICLRFDADYIRRALSSSAASGACGRATRKVPRRVLFSTGTSKALWDCVEWARMRWWAERGTATTAVQRDVARKQSMSVHSGLFRWAPGNVHIALRAGLLFALLAPVFFGGCDDTPTRVDLRVSASADFAVERLRIVIRSEDGRERYRQEHAFGMGARLPVYADAGSERFRFEVTALNATGELGTARGLVSYLRNSHGEVHIELCTGRTCVEERCYTPTSLSSDPTEGITCAPLDGGVPDAPGECISAPPMTVCASGRGRCQDDACCFCFDPRGRCVTEEDLSVAACGYGGGSCGVCCGSDRCERGVCEAAVPFVQVGSGADHSCASTADGEVYCWGSDAHGQLGVSEADESATRPVHVGRFGQVVVGLQHSCALDGTTLRCWGRNDAGQVGIAGGMDIDRPMEVAGAWQAVSAGNQFTCALGASSDHIVCFGSNEFYQLGDERLPDGPTPQEIAGSVALSDFASGFSHSIGRDSDGRLFGWGQQGITPRPMSCEPADGCFRLAATGMRPGWKQVSAGNQQSCAIDAFDDLYCWGRYLEELYPGGSEELFAVSHPTGGRFRTVETAGAQCALDEAGAIWCWGGGPILGGGVEFETPRRVDGSARWDRLGKFTENSVCAIAEGGNVYCWGSGGDGQLGTGSRVETAEPGLVCPD